jgi:hypothetical protein
MNDLGPELIGELFDYERLHAQVEATRVLQVEEATRWLVLSH